MSNGNPIVDCSSKTSDPWISSAITFYGRNFKYFWDFSKWYQWTDGIGKGGLLYSGPFKDSNGNKLGKIRLHVAEATQENRCNLKDQITRKLHLLLMKSLICNLKQAKMIIINFLYILLISQAAVSYDYDHNESDLYQDLTDHSFLINCMRRHNELRARHCVMPLYIDDDVRSILNQLFLMNFFVSDC